MCSNFSHVCRDDLNFTLAPWKTIQSLPMYIGDISKEEAEEILSNSDNGTFFLSNYDPRMDYDLGGSFILSMKTYDGDIKHITALSFSFTRRVWNFEPFTLHYMGYHMCSPPNFHDEHLKERCKLTWYANHPIIRTNPYSLMEIARAEVCEAYTFKDILSFETKGLIPKALATYVRKRHSWFPLTSRKSLFCKYGVYFDSSIDTWDQNYPRHLLVCFQEEFPEHFNVPKTGTNESENETSAAETKGKKWTFPLCTML